MGKRESDSPPLFWDEGRGGSGSNKTGRKSKRGGRRRTIRRPRRAVVKPRTKPRAPK